MLFLQADITISSIDLVTPEVAAGQSPASAEWRIAVAWGTVAPEAATISSSYRCTSKHRENATSASLSGGCVEGDDHICKRLLAKGCKSGHPKRLRKRRHRVDAGPHGCGSLSTRRRLVGQATARTSSRSRTPHPHALHVAPHEKTQGTMSNCRIRNPLSLMS